MQREPIDHSEAQFSRSRFAGAVAGKAPKNDSATGRSMLCKLVANLNFASSQLIAPLDRLFDELPNVVFFIKDHRGRYLAVNRTLVDRCGLLEKADVIGRLPSEIFPASLAANYETQDAHVLKSGRPLLNQLEKTLHSNRRWGWCLTSKYPIRDEATKRVSAVIGMSRDVLKPDPALFPSLGRVLHELERRICNPPTVQELAAIADVSMARLARLVRRVFDLSPQQLALKIRMDEALYQLANTEKPICEIAIDTGFCDQSAFTKCFRRVVGLTPGAFRTF